MLLHGLQLESRAVRLHQLICDVAEHLVDTLAVLARRLVGPGDQVVTLLAAKARINDRSTLAAILFTKTPRSPRP